MDYSDFRQSKNIDDRRPWIESAPVSLDELMTMLRWPMKKDWPNPYSLDGYKFPQIAADFPAGPSAPPTPLGMQAGYGDISAAHAPVHNPFAPPIFPDQQSSPSPGYNALPSSQGLLSALRFR